MAKSLFIEGSDGSGKSVQIKLLEDYIKAQGYEVLVLREPGGSDYYQALREFYLHSPHKHPPISDALLAAAGRAANIDETRQALAEGKWVISDRAYPSGYAYQATQGVDVKDIKAINQYSLRGFDYDIKILLDVSVETAMTRVSNSGVKKDYWESQDASFFADIRKRYLDLAKDGAYIVIDGESTIEEVHKNIVLALDL